MESIGTRICMGIADEGRLQQLLELCGQYLPPDQLDRACRFRYKKDACRYLVGKFLLFKGLAGQDHPPADLSRMQYTVYGKPYIPDMPAFNISHSGDVVVCAIDPGGNVGIDIELIRDVCIPDFARCFTKDELNVIHSSTSPVQQFYKYWTRKEAVAKADGRGVNILLSGLDTIPDRVDLNGKEWFLRQLPLLPDYQAHISTETERSRIHLACYDRCPEDAPRMYDLDLPGGELNNTYA